MALCDARMLAGATPALPEGPPYACSELAHWAGRSFDLPAGDLRLEAIHRGEPSPSPPMDNLQGMVRYWSEHPEWMAFMEPSSPIYRDKIIERAIYLEHWAKYLVPGARVLDLGGGVGRFALWLMERGHEVEVVDPDLRSLWRIVTQSAGFSGSLDVHWSTGEKLPDLEPVDVVIACEVLNYVERPRRVLENIQRVLKPGGTLLCSVEARWGWAMAADAHAGTLSAFLGDGIVHVPGDVWVRTYTEPAVRELLSDFDVQLLLRSHYTCSGPFELSAGQQQLETALAMEHRLRQHPIAGPLNRAWLVVAQSG